MSPSSFRVKAADLYRAAMKLVPQSLAPDYRAHRTISLPLVASLRKVSTSAETCFRNYDIDWRNAMSSETLQLPLPHRRYADENGAPIALFYHGGIMYLPDGGAKKELIRAKDELFAMLPKVFLRMLDSHMHITAFFLPNSNVLPGYVEHWKKSVAQICKGAAAPKFSIIGVNITKQGIIYAKCYPHDVLFQNLRDIEHRLFPASTPKDVYNITLGRAYNTLPKDEWRRAVNTVERYFRHLYFGEVQPDAVSLGNFEGSGIPDGKTPVTSIHLNPRPFIAPVQQEITTNLSADYFFLDRAIELAAKGNPEHLCKVGALIVRGDEVIGSAYKFKRRMMHAEVMAIMDAIKNLSQKDRDIMNIAKGLLATDYLSFSEEDGGAINLRRTIWETVDAVKEKTGKHIFDGVTIYVNLEPCDSYSPPFIGCSEVIARSGIRRAVVATTDPGLGKKEGYGLKYMRELGVEVKVIDELTAKARAIDPDWFDGTKIARNMLIKEGESNKDKQKEDKEKN